MAKTRAPPTTLYRLGILQHAIADIQTREP